MRTISDIFLYTADQERAHAGRFYDLLKELSGETIHIDGAYPIDQQDSIAGLLRAAQHNEHEEYARCLSVIRRYCKRRGVLRDRICFYQIAEIEHIHEERFGKLAQMLEENTYYASESVSVWMCTNCGYVHEGIQAPKVCPVCRHDQGYFIPYSLACYKTSDPIISQRPRNQKQGIRLFCQKHPVPLSFPLLFFFSPTSSCFLFLFCMKSALHLPKSPFRSRISVSAHAEHQPQNNISHNRPASTHGQKRTVCSEIGDSEIVHNIDSCLDQEHRRAPGSHKHTELISLP